MMFGLYTAPPSAGGTLILDATPFVDNATISTNERGFEALPGRVIQRLIEAFQTYDQSGTLYVGAFEGGTIVWEGRLEDPAVFAGAGGSGLQMQALGAWRALTDVASYIAFWSKSTVSGFRPVLTTEIATAQPDRFTFDAQNRLSIAPQKGATFGNTGAAKQAYYAYLAPDGNSKSIIGAQFAWTLTVPAINWRGAIIGQNADFSTNSIPWLFTSAGAGTTTRATHVTFAAVPIVSFFMDQNAADAVLAGETGSAFLRITRMRLVSSTTNEISTTLTANRAAGTNVTATVGSTTGMYVGQELCMNSANNPSEIVTVLSIGSATQFNATFVNAYVIGNAVQGFKITADEIVKHIIATDSGVNVGQLSSSTALVQSPGVDLLNEVYEDATPADVLTHLISLGDNQTIPRQWETGIYDNRVLFFRPRGDAARAWYVDVTDLTVARTLEDLINIVYAIYKDASGRRLVTAGASSPGSISRYGLSRTDHVTADTTSSGQAGIHRDALLYDHKDPLPRASVSFEAVYDAAGARYPLWMVRSGDSITIRNFPPSVSTTIDRVRTFRISHTIYTFATRTLQIELEIPPARLATLLARRSEGINKTRGVL